MATLHYPHAAFIYVFDYGPWLVETLIAPPCVWPLAPRVRLMARMRVTRQLPATAQFEYERFNIPVAKRTLMYYRAALTLPKRGRNVQASTNPSKS